MEQYFYSNILLKTQSFAVEVLSSYEHLYLAF